ncbi:DUF294 nucleotidyltransferase-like domain-containing protein [Alkalicoccus urumqiensis]|uniref:CBS domain-containing protein n=1 Tax=Alkalicoccus urumqiensis TaxID=1548213 RepID=A0A2P6MKY4_ALKUR|nr:DUF294 nucleotidyltransferase-like domain-containing protein [Alkalicoccus urumqiensis]PRO66947.1 hypothetical protein C6I21_03220 [Alkalicoccus urumqiensis]
MRNTSSQDISFLENELSAERFSECRTPDELNELHDERMKKIVEQALSQVESEQGNCPARFHVLVMGSTGRREQAVFSDQDHAIVFEGGTEHASFFRALGERFTDLMEQAGYERCEGKVMAEEPRWNTTLTGMHSQIQDWLHKGDWESIRYVLILFDSRVLFGQSEAASELKETMFATTNDLPHIPEKIMENTGFRKKRRNVFGQILTDNRGEVNFKTSILFPFVNAARTAAYFEEVTEAPTLSRMKALEPVIPFMKHAAASFEEALAFRHEKTKTASSYDSIHQIKINSLSAKEKEDVKRWMKDGKRLIQEVRSHYSSKERTSSS